MERVSNMVLSLKEISKSFGEKQILDSVTLSIEDRDRIGLIGVNGAGKTTLLNLLCGRLSPDQGEIGKKSGLTVGYLEQNTGLDREGTIWGEMLTVFTPLLDAQARMRELEAQMAAYGEHDGGYDRLAAEYSRLTAYFEGNDGYGIEVKIKTVLGGMGFSDKSYDTRISTLSGGEKTRLALARLLLEQPDLLMLDEPTNHLDFTTLQWLEDYLQSYKGALLVVSHDRYFLDKMVTSVWELDRTRLTAYKGNYSKYKVLRQERMERMQKEYEQQQQQIAAMKEYAERNIARATTANSAKSRLHQLANMELKEKPPSQLKAPVFSFSYAMEPVKEVLTVENLTLSVGAGEDRKVLQQNLSLAVRRGEKVAVIGPNGAGKSTLLKTVLGLMPRQGTVRWGQNVKTGYYEQENQILDFDSTVLEELWKRYPAWPERQVRGLLGNMRLTGDNVFKKVSVVSGGERAKLCFAILEGQNANTLILDEPTNHLDLPSKEALEKALREYTGTLLFVSHDRYFLNTIPDRIVELTPQGVVEYNGRYDDYLEQKKLRESQEIPEFERPSKPAGPTESAKGNYRSKQQRSEETRRRTRLRRLEEAIAAQEQEMGELETAMTQPENLADYTVLNDLCARLEAVKLQHEADFEEWMSLQEEE